MSNNGIRPDEAKMIVKRKEMLIKALKKTMGNVSAACRMCKLTNKTYYDYLKHDKDFAQKIKDIDFEEAKLDFAEFKLFKLINDEVPASVFFYLNNKGQSRGYNTKENNQNQTTIIVKDV